MRPRIRMGITYRIPCNHDLVHNKCRKPKYPGRETYPFLTIPIHDQHTGLNTVWSRKRLGPHSHKSFRKAFDDACQMSNKASIVGCAVSQMSSSKQGAVILHLGAGLIGADAAVDLVLRSMRETPSVILAFIEKTGNVVLDACTPQSPPSNSRVNTNASHLYSGAWYQHSA
jgi:hypothetical protein